LALNTAGELIFNVGGTGGTYTGGVLLSPGTTGVIWVSFDATTGIMRAGENNINVVEQNTMTYNRTGAGTSTVCYPFSFQNSGNAGNQGLNRWMLFNKAYMNSSVPSDDAAFTNLVSEYAGYLE